MNNYIEFLNSWWLDKRITFRTLYVERQDDNKQEQKLRVVRDASRTSLRTE